MRSKLIAVLVATCLIASQPRPAEAAWDILGSLLIQGWPVAYSFIACKVFDKGCRAPEKPKQVQESTSREVPVQETPAVPPECALCPDRTDQQQESGT